MKSVVQVLVLGTIVLASQVAQAQLVPVVRSQEHVQPGYVAQPGYVPYTPGSTAGVQPLVPMPVQPSPFPPGPDSVSSILSISPTGVEEQFSSVHTRTVRPLPVTPTHVQPYNHPTYQQSVYPSNEGWIWNGYNWQRNCHTIYPNYSNGCYPVTQPHYSQPTYYYYYRPRSCLKWPWE